MENIARYIWQYIVCWFIRNCCHMIKMISVEQHFYRKELVCMGRTIAGWGEYDSHMRQWSGLLLFWYDCSSVQRHSIIWTCAIILLMGHWNWIKIWSEKSAFPVAFVLLAHDDIIRIICLFECWRSGLWPFYHSLYHDMEADSVLLPFVRGIHRSSAVSLTKFVVLIVVNLNKHLNNKSIFCWFEMQRQTPESLQFHHVALFEIVAGLVKLMVWLLLSSFRQNGAN